MIFREIYRRTINEFFDRGEYVTSEKNKVVLENKIDFAGS